MRLIDLNGKWQMKRTDRENWTPAQVPGSVYHDLLEAGLMEDPFYRDNEYKALELSRHDYEYQRFFEVGRNMLAHDRITLLCEGLDTICELFINGSRVLSACNMHRTYETDVKNVLVEGRNEIRAVFSSPVNYVERMQKERPLTNSSDAVEGISHLRKAHCMFGWDWGPKLPDMGIWRSISIACHDRARIGDVYITQCHTQGKVTLDVRTRVESWNAAEPRLRVDVTAPDGSTLTKTAAVCGGENHLAVEIQNPRLWWPNGMGKQPLYNVRVSLADAGQALDDVSLRIGLRTLEVRREKDQWGETFEFVVNGIPIFSKGADYIPEDNILARCSRKRTERLIRSCVDANFNTVRVWGGGFYPEDYFYDLCDEYGLIVWQDLMYACGVYELTDDFRENIARETQDNIKRLRHHASLGLWCGNNEQEEGWAGWGWSQSFSPKLKADYIKQYEVLLPEIAKETDPNTFYWPSSPSSGGSFDKPNDENMGDMHYWEVWHGRLPFTAYRTIFPRFMSEFGIQSFPSLKTVKTFTLPEDRNIFSYVMESHQKNGTANETILYYVGQTYKMPKDFDSLLYTSQLLQAEGLRYGVEHWRRNRGRCMGSIYWQLNDCWPVASWSSIDYFGRWKALHYLARRFFAPVLASACEDGTSVSLHVTNDTLEEVSGTLSWKLSDADGAAVAGEEIPVRLAALSSGKFADLDLSAQLDSIEKKRKSFLAYSLILGGKPVSAGTVLFVKPKHFSFKDPKISVKTEETPESFVLDVTSNSYAKFVELDLTDGDAIFSDNYFDLPAGETKRVEAAKADLSRSLSLEDFKKQLTVRSVYDTFE